MSEAVIAHGGMIDKFIGDAIMAVYGVSFARTNAVEVAQDVQSAVRTAIAMRERLADLNARWQSDGMARLSMRIGIHTGPVVAGSLGGRERLEYTVPPD